MLFLSTNQHNKINSKRTFNNVCLLFGPDRPNKKKHVEMYKNYCYRYITSSKQ